MLGDSPGAMTCRVGPSRACGQPGAAHHGRIEIIHGQHLKSPLKEHLGLDVRIRPPASGPAQN
jgi:hypothetical protein